MPPSTDANGVEALAGESEAEYVARQQRLREEAAARMRAKFGGSGGLGGGMPMGGIGSQPQAAQGSGWLSSIGSGLGAGLSVAGAGLSVAGDIAHLAKEKAKQKLASAREAGSGGSFSSSDFSHLAKAGGGGIEGSRDLSDLLGRVDVSDQPPMVSHIPAAVGTKPTSASFGTADGWGDDAGWSSVPAVSMKAAPASPLPQPPMVSSSLSASSPSHFSGATSATKPKKVAAVKSKNDSSWDDWGDDKW